MILKKNVGNHKKRIALFWPMNPSKNLHPDYFFGPSLTMAFLSKVLEEAGFEVTVIDSSLVVHHEELVSKPSRTLEKLLSITENTKPDILGIGSWTYTLLFTSEFTRLFKARNPDVPIIMGGYEATFIPEDILNLLPHIDYLVRGEGEYTLLELCQALSSNKEGFGKIKGISYRNEEGKIVHTPDRPLIENLDELPLVDFDNFISLPKEISVPTLFSRGCPFNCSFCSMHNMWKHQRFNSPDYIIKQIKHFQKKYNILEFRNVTDNFITNKVWAIKTVRAIHATYPNWSIGTSGRIDMISRDLFSVLKKNNVNNIYLGVESIIPESLLFFKKTNDPIQYIKRIPISYRILDELGIEPHSSFIIGAPNENKDDMIKLKEIVIKLKEKYEKVDCSSIIIYPGTGLWNKLQNGEINIYKFEEGNIQRPFGDKYNLSSVFWFAPDAYAIENNNMSNEEHKRFLSIIIAELKQKIGR